MITMQGQAKAAVIVNRAAGKGAAAGRWPAIQAELARRLGAFETHFTEAPGHGTSLARTALANGARRIVAVGGDGTVNEALNGLLDPSGRLAAPDAVLCPVPAGTANELCRALGYLQDPPRALDAVASGRSRAIDLMRVRCVGLDGRPVDRFGYLIVALGAAATISHRTSQSRWLKKLGEIAYLLMTPPVTLGYRQRDVALAIDGAEQGKRRLFTAMIGNTENGGGGMKLVPGARFDDGLLDLIEIGGMSRFDALLRIIPKLYSGAHVHHPKVRLSRGTTFGFKSEVETLVDLDGETVGRLPLQVSVLPQAFNVGAP
jgi:YegS/Rv2252/BmrU family lipid kinase